MTIIITSIKRGKGTYEGKDYDNTFVYGSVVGAPNGSWLCGPEIFVGKFKSEAFAAALDRNLKALNKPEISGVGSLAGLKLSPVFDRYGNCEDFTLSVD